MAQSGYTPIQLYYSTTAAAVPVNTNLASGELAINITDGKLYYKNNSGVVTLLAGATSGPAGGSNTQVQYNSSGALAGSSALTFDGTNLAVGTTTIANSLTDVLTVGKNSGTYDASIVVRQFGAGTASGLQLIAADNTGASYNSITSTTSGGTQHWKLGGVGGSSGTLPFSVSGSEGMRLTSTGLGIGTSSPSEKLEVYGTTPIFQINDRGLYQAQFGLIGNDLEIRGSSGAIEFYNGAADGASSTLKATLDASGNLCVGSTSAGNAGTINVSVGNPGTTSGGLQLWATTTQTHVIQWGDGTTGSDPYRGYIEYAHNGDSMRFGTAATEKMRLDTSGNLMVGTTTGSARFTANLDNSTAYANTAPSVSNCTVSLTNGSGHTSGGTFVGTQFNLSGNSSNRIGYIGAITESTGNQALTLVFGTNTAAGDRSEKARLTAAGGWAVGTTADPGAGAIYATGNITAYYSDKRLKTVSGKIENALDKVAQLSGVYYTNNSVAKSFGYDSDEVQVGVLAQDVEAVLPQIVKAAPFDLDEHGNSKSGENYKTVQYERLVPLLIEAINELQAKVKALEAK